MARRRRAAQPVRPAVGALRPRTGRRRRSPSCARRGTRATGISSTAVTPSSTRSASRSIAASNVPPRRERADVQLVDHESASAAPPAGVGPGERRGSTTADGAVHAVGLEPRRRIGEAVAVVEPVAVAARRAEPSRRPPRGSRRAPAAAARRRSAARGRARPARACGAQTRNVVAAVARSRRGPELERRRPVAAQQHDGERRQGERRATERLRRATGTGPASTPPMLPYAAAAVDLGVAVDELGPVARRRDADPVVRAAAPA